MPDVQPGKIIVKRGQVRKGYFRMAPGTHGISVEVGRGRAVLWALAGHPRWGRGDGHSEAWPKLQHAKRPSTSQEALIMSASLSHHTSQTCVTHQTFFALCCMKVADICV
jgi:hypothetical protein